MILLYYIGWRCQGVVTLLFLFCKTRYWGFFLPFADALAPLGQREDLTVMASGGSSPPRILLSYYTLLIVNVKGAALIILE